MYYQAIHEPAPCSLKVALVVINYSVKEYQYNGSNNEDEENTIAAPDKSTIPRFFHPGVGSMKGFYRFALLTALVLLLIACTSAPSNQLRLKANSIDTPDQWLAAKPMGYPHNQWPKLYQGMSKSDFFNHLPLLRKIKKVSGIVFLDYGAGRRFSFSDDQLQLSQPIEQCLFFPGEGGGWQMQFPLPIQQTWDLFYNSATLLGLNLRRQLNKNEQENGFQSQQISKTPNRKFPVSDIEAIIQLKIIPQGDKTRVYLNSESTELVWKSRDKSYVQSIFEHMACSYQLSQPKPDSPPIIIDAEDDKFQLTLLNQQLLSKLGSKVGDKVEFVGKSHEKMVIPGKLVYETEEDDSPLVTFYHDEHNKLFGNTCADCHKNESCSRCHDKSDTLQTIEKDAHENCMSCHQQEIDDDAKCKKCHATKEKPRCPKVQIGQCENLRGRDTAAPQSQRQLQFPTR